MAKYEKGQLSRFGHKYEKSDIKMFTNFLI